MRARVMHLRGQLVKLLPQAAMEMGGDEAGRLLATMAVVNPAQRGSWWPPSKPCVRNRIWNAAVGGT